MTLMKSRACYKDYAAFNRAFGKALDAFIAGKVDLVTPGQIEGGKRKSWYWLEVTYSG